jgi:acetyl esterase/lipase
MVSAQARTSIEAMQSAAATPLLPLSEERANWEALARKEKLPEGTLVSGAALNGVPCEWVERADSDHDVILFIHGGGFTRGSPRTHRPLAASLTRASGRRLVVPDYRLAPEEPFPAGLDDIVAVYAALVEDGLAPEAIAFAGDSSGAGLALAAALKLKEIGAPLPGALVSLCGWLDLTLTAASLDEPGMLPSPSRAELERNVACYAGAEDRHNPLLSPVFGALAGLPPLLLQAAGRDRLLDDSITLAARAREAGVAVTLSVAAELWHGFQATDCPEARAAVEEAAAFVNNALPQRAT